VSRNLSIWYLVLKISSRGSQKRKRLVIWNYGSQDILFWKSNLKVKEKSWDNPPSPVLLSSPSDSHLASFYDTWRTRRSLSQKFLAPRRATYRVRREFNSLCEGQSFSKDFDEKRKTNRSCGLWDRTTTSQPTTIRSKGRCPVCLSPFWIRIYLNCTIKRYKIYLKRY
jgi:hypothetical protein